jgi:polynucleotide 5'-triphosphatase
MLNSRVDQCGDPGYVGSSVRYEHSRDIDSFHPIPNSGGVKTRVTRNQKDHKIKTVVEKERMADMNIHSPKRLFDWRISVSVEKPGVLCHSSKSSLGCETDLQHTLANMPTTEAINSRYKDRISYTHQIIQVDLTKVGSSMNESPDDAFELEIEFRDAKVLLREAQKEARGEDNLYMDMVQCFLNNIRTFRSIPFEALLMAHSSFAGLLIRNAAEP